jgi:16S rRNA (uracil1498-N3)-methyltransferase
MPDHDFLKHRLFVAEPLAEGAVVPLTREAGNYLLNVLRMAAGDGLLVFNGRDGEWQASVQGPRKQAELLVGAQTRPQPPATDIWCCFAPLKAARLDYMVQKAVEMGAGRLQPVMTRRTQVSRLNRERMQANVTEAAEQCGVLAVPEVAEEVRLERLLADWPEKRALVFCDERAVVADPVPALASRVAGRPAALLIGPEGGFDPAEREAVRRLPQAVPVALGPRILRGDTALVAGLAVLQAAAGDWRTTA